MRESAATDHGDRLELINIALMNKKLAAAAEALTEEEDPEAYWRLHFQLQSVKRNFMVDRYAKSIEIPDMSELAQERYHTEKDKYAKVPEHRLTSHILFMCQPGKCDREPVRTKARKVLQQLQDGADFEEMVEQHSEDPGSKEKGGLYDKWFSLGGKGVEPRYTGGAFEIEEVGQYSDLVETQFGVHLIRLDGIREEHYLPYEEVKDSIISHLRAEYRKLAMKEYEAQLMISDDAYIDGPAMDEILEPYKKD
ncbi:peptidylprolyl isomerase [Kineobactrum salinum]|uniref:peptidylprolyl isomerase n=1 Tax=Kineobactrum salinum TaxID=2708301 RepID=A0A6C0U9I3_9GAMM|nr:peptidylprolyl isomerase [Kineobactrum salinum]QIB66324.1 hypothetical protein G3T16_13820 [Kineobactrum salinum]